MGWGRCVRQCGSRFDENHLIGWTKFFTNKALIGISSVSEVGDESLCLGYPLLLQKREIGEASQQNDKQCGYDCDAERPIDWHICLDPR